MAKHTKTTSNLKLEQWNAMGKNWNVSVAWEPHVEEQRIERITMKSIIEEAAERIRLSNVDHDAKLDGYKILGHVRSYLSDELGDVCT